MTAPILLLHSPLVGPCAWAACGAALAARGREVRVAALPTGLVPPFYAAMAAATAKDLEAPATLVVHSGAGALVPAIAAAAPGRVRSVIFADAILPHPGRSWFDTAGADLGQALRAVSGDGLVPSWDQWFPPDTLGKLLPDVNHRATFLAELKPVPLAYLEEMAPEIELPPRTPWGYLRLSKAYEREAAEARRVGAPTLRTDLHHLAMMTDPEAVATSLLQLMRMLG
jgi:pimeloyl-ACP methyl ester carboxylesterase